MTSLSGIVITVVTAATDSPTLACSNAIGGITAQTLATICSRCWPGR